MRVIFAGRGVQKAHKSKGHLKALKSIFRWASFLQKQKKMDTLAEAMAVVAARRGLTKDGPMPPAGEELASALGATSMGPKLLRYVLECPEPDMGMLARLLELRAADADAEHAGLEIFNRCAPPSLRMSREAMLRSVASTRAAETATAAKDRGEGIRR